MGKTKILFLFLILFIFSFNIYSVSLWDDRAGDIYNKKIYYNIGDSIQVVITEDSNYEYKSSNKSLKSYKIDVRGGEISGFFDFIPQGGIEENKTGSERDNLKIKNSIQATVTGINNNIVTLRGTKNLSLNNKLNRITLAGQANIFDIKDNMILSSNLINSTLSITTLLENQNNIITNNDLVTELVNPDVTSDTRTQTKLSDAKRRELIIEYFNKILNVIF